jgi:hypothetical protein
MKEGVEVVLLKIFIGPEQRGDDRSGRRDGGSQWWSSLTPDGYRNWGEEMKGRALKRGQLWMAKGRRP